MSRSVQIDLFCEDRAHEELLKHLIRVMCRREKTDGRIEVRSARGGHGKALDELRSYQVLVERRGLRRPDLLVVAIDANCSSYAPKVREIREAIKPDVFPYCAIACPDPHIERWYTADSDAFRQAVGATPPAAEPRCDKQSRNVLKKALAHAVRAAGHPAILGGIEFAAELAEAMDLFRAGKADAALKHFVEEVMSALRQLKGD
ncbi:MAG TPA: hypothetical protein PLE19_00345 [Planctomycetota bacterium]|nr:hypothetical protein [Planctomycetota bacterium]HRR79288.1 hypothetical protein [Planctomycetota bacterium]HRT96871.1 hypothetical protein [Planctomycetota bacterium]